MTDWRPYAQRLASELRASGDLHCDVWCRAVCEVPRHLLVPKFYEQNPDATWCPVEALDHLDTVYSDTTLITAIADMDQGPTAVSSSTAPGLMVAMLEALEVHDGAQVCQIGTATGYNDAWLSHRLGDQNVTSVDIDPQFVDHARARLGGLGYHPALYAHDGAQGVPDRAPYDRILSTCAVAMVPWPWVEQTKRGGRILTDLKPSTGLAGNLVMLERDHDQAEGRFWPSWAGFMPMRHNDTSAAGTYARRDHNDASERRTTAPITPWEHTVPWFLAQLDDGMPSGLTYGAHIDPDTGDTTSTYLAATDGSWCELALDDRGGWVLEAGPISLWARFESAYNWWREAGEPGWSRFGLTVTEATQTVWLDSPAGFRWPLGRTNR